MVVTPTLSPLWALCLEPAVGQPVVASRLLWRRSGRALVCFGGSPLPGAGCKAPVLFSGWCLPAWSVFVLLETPCLSLFAFLYVKKRHVKASGAGNVPRYSPCWLGQSLGDGDKERGVPAQRAQPLFSLKSPPMLPPLHPPSCLPTSPA